MSESETPWHVEAAAWLANDDLDHFDTVHWLHEALAEREHHVAQLLAARREVWRLQGELGDALGRINRAQVALNPNGDAP